MLLSVGSSAKGLTRGPSLPTRSTRPPYNSTYAFIAAADIEDVSETAILLFKRQHLVRVDGFAGPGRPDDEHDPHAIHIHVLKEGRPVRVSKMFRYSRVEVL